MDNTLVNDIAKLAVSSKAIRTAGANGNSFITHHKDFKITDLDDLAAMPARSKYSISVSDVPSFKKLCASLTVDTPVIFSDFDKDRISAYTEFHTATGASHCEKTIHYQLENTLEYKRLRRITETGQDFTQKEFHDFIEDNSALFNDPNELEMLAIAKSFTIKQGEHLDSSIDPQSGNIKIAYSKDHAGTYKTGNITLPNSIMLNVQPYKGHEVFNVKARFKIRLRNGYGVIGLDIPNLDRLEEEAFNLVCAKIEKELSVKPINLSSVASSKFQSN